MPGFFDRMQFALTAGDHRHAGVLHGLPRLRFVAHLADGVGGRADDLDAALGAELGEFGVFGQRAVAGMDGVGVGQFGGADDIGKIAVAVLASRRTDADVFVGERHVQRVGVGQRVDGHRVDAHLLAGANDAEGDFAAVGDEYFVKQGRLARANFEDGLVVLDRLRVVDEDFDDLACDVGRDFVHDLHRLDDADGLAIVHARPFCDEGFGLG